MAQRLIWKRYNGPDGGKWQEYTLPELGPGDIRIRVEASGVNYADVLMIRGKYPDAPSAPAAPGYEVAGTILEAGDESDLRVGQRVVALTRFGGYSSEVVIPGAWACPLPDNINAVDGAALPVNGLTAWVALREMGRIRDGDTVLIHSASGGVGQLAIQLCLNSGARPVCVVSRREKADALAERFPGIANDIIINKDDSYGQELKKRDLGVNISLNPVAGDTIHIDQELLEPFGTLVIFGIARASNSGPLGLLWNISPILLNNPLRYMKKNIGMYGINLLNLFGLAEERIRPTLAGLLDEFSRGKIQSAVTQTWPLPEGAQALRALMERRAVGKLVLTGVKAT